jgi:hypothetical protein
VQRKVFTSSTESPPVETGKPPEKSQSTSIVKQGLVGPSADEGGVWEELLQGVAGGRVG